MMKSRGVHWGHYRGDRDWRKLLSKKNSISATLLLLKIIQLGLLVLHPLSLFVPIPLTLAEHIVPVLNEAVVIIKVVKRVRSSAHVGLATRPIVSLVVTNVILVIQILGPLVKPFFEGIVKSSLPSVVLYPNKIGEK